MTSNGPMESLVGVPMLGVLENHRITNSCGYPLFWGIKLGAGGLIFVMLEVLHKSSRLTGRNQRAVVLGITLSLFPTRILLI